MTKQLLNGPGRVRLTYKVTSMRGRRAFSSIEIGVKSSYNIGKAVRTQNSFLENARLNAIYKHMAKGGSSRATTELIEYDIEYFYEQAKFERKKYRDGEYYDVVTDRRDGKVIGATKKKYELEM